MANISVIYDDSLLLDQIVQSVTYSGDIKQAYRRVEIEIKNTIDGSKRAVDILEGKKIQLLEDGEERFVGVVISTSIDALGNMQIKAYDEGFYLVNNFDTKKFTNMTASAIIRQLCAQFQIPIGSIAETDYVIPKLILRNNSLWEMMITALTLTRQHKGRKFLLYSKGGRINLIERKEVLTTVLFDAKTNIERGSYSRSIEELRTQVRVVAETEGKNPIVAVVKNDSLIKQFGLLQHFEDASTDMTRSQIEQLANQLLADLGKITDEARIDALGISTVIAGSSVYVYEPVTGIVGAYYVSSDTHTFSNGIHRMSVTLSATDELPTLAYTPPPEIKRSTSASSSIAGYQAAIDRLG